MYFWLSFLAPYLPFELALNPAPGVDLASIRVLILAIFGVWLMKSLKDKKVSVTNNLTAAFIVIFLFLNLLSIFWAQNPDWSMRKLLFLLSIFPLYFAAGSIMNNFSRVQKIAQLLVASGTVVSIMGIFQSLGQFIWGLGPMYKFWANFVIWPFLGKSFSQSVLKNTSWLVNISGTTYLRATATFPDPHMFSFFLGMLIPFALALYLTSKRKIYLAALITMTIADALTFSRGGYLGLLAGIFFLVVFFWSHINLKLKIAGGVTMILLVLILIIPSPISERFFSSFDLHEGSNEGRLTIWNQALNVIDDHFLFGVGIGNYPLAVNPTADYRDPIYAHNTYLDIAAETGILSVLAWMGILFFAFKNYLKKTSFNLFFLGGAASIIIFFVHSLVETAIYSPVVLTLLVIILSISNMKTENEKNT